MCYSAPAISIDSLVDIFLHQGLCALTVLEGSTFNFMAASGRDLTSDTTSPKDESGLSIDFGQLELCLDILGLPLVYGSLPFHLPSKQLPTKNHQTPATTTKTNHQNQPNNRHQIPPPPPKRKANTKKKRAEETNVLRRPSYPVAPGACTGASGIFTAGSTSI